MADPTQDSLLQIDPTTGQLVQKPAVKQPDGTLAGQTSALGLPAQPSTPSGAASIGASPDAAKMVGTPNQLAGQLQSPGQIAGGGRSTGESAAAGGVAAEAAQQTGAAGSPATLMQADRQTGAGKLDEQAATEAARAQKYSQMFGQVGFGVAAMISAAVRQSQSATAGSAGAQGKLADDATLAGALPSWSNLTADQQAAAKSAIQQYAANPSADGLANLQNQLAAQGIDKNDLANPSVWAPKLLTQGSVGALTAGQLEDHLTLDPGTLQSFGITPADLQMLGLSQSDAQGMTLQQFRQYVADREQESSQQVAGLQAKLQDPNLSQNDRIAINQQLAALGAAGAQASAKATAAEAAGVRTDQQINIGGQQYTVEQLLDDPTMSNLVDSYMNAGPNDQIRKDLSQQLPDLAKFIDSNQKALEAAGMMLHDTANTVGKVQSANTNTLNAIQQQLGGASSAGSQQLSQLMTQIYPDTFGSNAKFTAHPIDLSKSGVLQLISSGQLGTDAGGGNVAAKLVSDLSTMAQSDPSGVQKLLQMSPDELQKTGLSSPENLTQLMASQSQAKALASGTPDQIAQAFFPSAGDMNTAQSELAAKHVFGEDTPGLAGSLFSHDLGYIGTNNDIAKALQYANLGNATSIADAISGKKIAAAADPLANFGRGAKGAQEAKLAKDMVGGALLDPGKVINDFGSDPGALQQILSSGIPMTTQVKQSIADRLKALTAPPALPAATPPPSTPTQNNSEKTNPLANAMAVNASNAPGAKQASIEAKKIFGGLGH